MKESFSILYYGSWSSLLKAEHLEVSEGGMHSCARSSVELCLWEFSVNLERITEHLGAQMNVRFREG